MNAAEAFVAGRGAVRITELAKWADRSVRHLYEQIGRGTLRMFGPGKVTSDSIVEWYGTFQGGGADVRRAATSSTDSHRRGGAPISSKEESHV